MTLSDDTIYVPREELVVERIEDETLILDLETNEYFGLNEVGGEIIEQMGPGVTLDDIVSSIVERFDVSPQQARHDVADFVEGLLDAGLLMEMKNVS